MAALDATTSVLGINASNAKALEYVNTIKLAASAPNASTCTKSVNRAEHESCSRIQLDMRKVEGGANGLQHPKLCRMVQKAKRSCGVCVLE